MAQRYNISKDVKLFFFDGLMLIPLLFTMLLWSLTWLYITIGLSITLAVLGGFGYKPMILARKIRTLFAGSRKAIRPKSRKAL